MRGFTEIELKRMRDEQISSLQDECTHFVSILSSDGFGQTIQTFEEGHDFPCGFEPGGQNESAMNAGVGVVQTLVKSPRIRLPLYVLNPTENSSMFKAEDRIHLTKRFGEELLEPLVFEIVGEPQIGVTGVVLELKEIKPENQ